MTGERQTDRQKQVEIKKIDEQRKRQRRVKGSPNRSHTLIHENCLGIKILHKRYNQ